MDVTNSQAKPLQEFSQRPFHFMNFNNVELYRVTDDKLLLTNRMHQRTFRTSILADGQK